MALFPINRVSRPMTESTSEAASWVEGLARLGYAAKGAVYIVVGLLATHAALGSGRVSSNSGSEGAIATILRQPLGKILVAIIAIGLFGYALWRFVQAALDPEHRGSDAKGAAIRAGFVVSGLLHLGLAVEAARMILSGGGGGSGGGGQEADHWTAMLMRQPFGVWLAVILGVGIASFGVYELYKAFTVRLTRRLDLSQMSQRARTWTIRFGRLGYAARGVVFGIIGVLLIQAALQYDPSDAVGVGGALRALQQQSHGPWLLGAVAVGLIAYGLFEMIKARYRRVRPAA